jgi:putative spermidine/putrescine transport system substrate-binding protein
MPFRLTRRAFLGTAVTTVALSGCGGKKADELRVFCYAGNHEAAMRTAFVPAFEAATGATVALLSGWWEGLPKLKTAPADDPPFDIMITDATQGYPAARDGLFAPINFANVPSVSGLSPAALEPWVYRDKLGLPYPDSVMTLAFHRAAGEPLTRWADLLRPDLSGKIGLYNSFYMSLYTFAAILADVSGKPGTAHDLIRERLDEVFRFAVESRKRVGLWWANTTDMLVSLGKREVLAGNMHGADYLVPLKEKPDFGAAVPATDRAMVQVFWAIPAGCKRKGLAEAALDVMFGHEVQLGFARHGLATPRRDTAAQMATEDPRWATFSPHTADQFRTLKYYPYDEYAKQWDALSDRWDRTVLRG